MTAREFVNDLDAERFQRTGVSREQLCDALDILMTVLGREVDAGWRFRPVWALYRRLPGWLDVEQLLTRLEDYHAQCKRGWDRLTPD